MDNQDKQSSWDDLARELGADAPAEPTEIPKTTYVKTTESEERRKAAEPPARPKPTPKSWDNLAADLGLEVPPPPPEPVERPKPAERAKIQPASSESAPPRPERTSRPERPRSGERHVAATIPRGERSPRRERSDRSENVLLRNANVPPPKAPHRKLPRPKGVPRVVLGAVVHAMIAARTIVAMTVERERVKFDREMANAGKNAPARSANGVRGKKPSTSHAKNYASLSPPPTPEPEPPAAPSLGVSLWHKIFGSPDQQAERIAESSSSAEIEREIDSEVDRDDWRRDKRRGRDEESRASSSENEIGESLEVRETWESETVEFARRPG